MGYRLSARGVEPDQQRVKAIDELLVPTNVKEVRRFLGIIGYYRRFIAKFAEMVQPLTNLLRKGSKFAVTQEVRDSVKQCKEALKTAPVLMYPDLNSKFTITTDASNLALGGVLSQGVGEAERPVAFTSRKLSPPETRYSAIERELLGVVWAIEQFRPYVYGRDFTIRTDHKPLLWVNKLKETSARITKWKEYLAGYSFQIEHVKGTENVIADALSRNVRVTELQQGAPENTAGGAFEARDLREWLETGPELQLVEDRVQSEGTSEPVRSGEQLTSLEWTDEIINAKRYQIHLKQIEGNEIVSQHHRYGPIHTTLVSIGKDCSDNEVYGYLNTILQRGKVYHWWSDNGDIMKKVEAIWLRHRVDTSIPIVICARKVETVENSDDQREIMLAYHVGKTNHRGTTETLAQLRRRYYWLGMHQKIAEFIGSCEVCKRSKYERAPIIAQQMVTETPQQINEIWECDLFVVAGHTFLTIIDRLSRLAAAWPLKNKSALSVQRALLRQFSLLDVPQKMIMDNGREFQNRRIRDFLQEWGVRVHFTTPGHPKSHGSIERLHNTLMEHLVLLKEDKGLIGKPAMTRAILAYNSSIHSANQATPFEVHQGKINTREVHAGNRRDKEERVRQYNRRHAENLAGRFKIGMRVFLRNHQKRLKLDTRWHGPFIIVGFLPRGRVKL